MCDERVTNTAPLRCLEFFAGIGGFHYALKESGLRCEVIAAFDINDVTNAVYAHNFPATPVRQCNIQALTAEFYDKQNADLWTMSPPCQPFTKKGLKRDVEDRRCDALKSICSALLGMELPPRYIVVENVQGFETSTAHRVLLNTLDQLHYSLQEFLLSPVDLDIPNSRPRYYLLAKHDPSWSPTHIPVHIVSNRLPDRCASVGTVTARCIGDYVCDECDSDATLRVKGEIAARYARGMDLVSRSSSRSSCFTKSYSLLVGSSGPILVSSPLFQMANPKSDDLMRRLSEAESIDEQIAVVRPLGLRYFSWREMANLMGFPSAFSKPEHITQKQMYRALGNSINVNVVSVLLTHLLL